MGSRDRFRIEAIRSEVYARAMHLPTLLTAQQQPSVWRGERPGMRPPSTQTGGGPADARAGGARALLRPRSEQGFNGMMKDQLDASRPETAQVIGFDGAVPMAYFRRGIPNPRMNESGGFRQCLGPRTRQIPRCLDPASVDWHRRLPKELSSFRGGAPSTGPKTSASAALLGTQAALGDFSSADGGSSEGLRRSVKSTRDGTSTLSLSVRVDPEGRSSPKRQAALRAEQQARGAPRSLGEGQVMRSSKGLFDEKFPTEGRWPSFFDAAVGKPPGEKPGIIPRAGSSQWRRAAPRRERSILDWSFQNMSASEDRGLDMRPLL